MTVDEKEINRKLRILNHADQSGDEADMESSMSMYKLITHIEIIASGASKDV